MRLMIFVGLYAVGVTFLLYYRMMHEMNDLTVNNNRQMEEQPVRLAETEYEEQRTQEEEEEEEDCTASVESVCRCAGGTAAQLWSRSHEELKKGTLAALRKCWFWYKDDELDYALISNFTQHQLQALTPGRLQRAIKSPGHARVWKQVLQVVLNRIQDPDNNAPLKIAVWGGSVTEGCRVGENNPFRLHPMEARYKPECTWGQKLETIFNSLFHNQTVIEVDNFAIAGTDTDVASAMVEYQLTVKNLSDYDVFISAFSSNDALAPTGRDRDRHILTMQRLNRLFLEQRPCEELPLVIQLEDTLTEALDIQGPMPLFEGLLYHREMVQTNSWAGPHFVSLSYPDAVRDVVYRNKRDTTLHTYQSLHPGYQMHTGIAYMLLYTFLEGMLSGACNANLESDPLGLPLPMYTDQNQLNSEDLRTLWKTQQDQRNQLCKASTDSARDRVIPGTADECEYAWVAAQWQVRTKGDVEKAMTAHITENVGWYATGDDQRKPKRTWETSQEGAHFTMQWDTLSKPVNSILVVFMRTDNKQWKGSELQIVVEQSSDGTVWNQVADGRVIPVHDTRSTINYARRIMFDTIDSGSSFRIHFQMVGGRMFQLNGMAVCHVTPTDPDDPTTLPEGYQDPSIPESAENDRELPLPSSASPFVCPLEPCNINIAFVGDSITRYQYYSMAYFFRHNKWIDPNSSPNLIRPKDYMQGNEFGWWTEWYNASAAALAPYENCDCYRKKGFAFLNNVCENRYYYDPTRNITLTYIQAFGTGVDIRGHWEADKAFPEEARKEEARLEKIGGWEKDSNHVAPPVGPHYEQYPFKWKKGWVDMIHDHLAKILPSHVILNAGKWKHNFDDLSVSGKIKAALDQWNMVGIWKTTTAEVGGQYSTVHNWKGEDWNKTDHLMCKMFSGCLNNSGWTAKLDEKYYMDSKHFVEPVYRKLNEEILDYLKIETTVPNLGWTELGIESETAYS